MELAHDLSRREDDFAIEAISAIRQGDNAAAARIFEQLYKAESFQYQPSYTNSLGIIVGGLYIDEWSHSRNSFVELEFCSTHGDVLFIGPYMDRRKGIGPAALTAIFGKEVISHRVYEDLYQEVCKDPKFNLRYSYFAPVTMRENPALLITFDPKATAGLAYGDTAETFFPPTFWDFWTPAEYGPALLNVPLVEQRLNSLGRQNVRSIFESDSAELLTAVLDDSIKSKIIIADEYFFHEIGHLHGLPIQQKFREDMMKKVWPFSVEEWRADGIGFDAQRHSTFGQGVGVAFNLLLRFGLDAHRPRLFAEVDTNASLLTFDRLFKNGAIHIAQSGKLSFTEVSYDFLAEAAKPIIEEARIISLREMETLEKVKAFERQTYDSDNIDKFFQEYYEYRELQYKRCYSQVAVSSESKALFMEKITEPCKKHIPLWLR